MSCSTVKNSKKIIRSKKPKNPRAPAARDSGIHSDGQICRVGPAVSCPAAGRSSRRDEVPGSWFGVGPMGSLTTTERRDKYNAQAVEYCEVREFPGATRGARKTKKKAIRFICLAHAADEPNSDGYWMKLSQWNRYHNDTFKDRRDDELPFIPAQAPAAEGGVAVKTP